MVMVSKTAFTKNRYLMTPESTIHWLGNTGIGYIVKTHFYKTICKNALLPNNTYLKIFPEPLIFYHKLDTNLNQGMLVTVVRVDKQWNQAEYKLICQSFTYTMIDLINSLSKKKKKK